MAEETTTTEVQELESLEKQNQENLAEVNSADQQSAEESKIVEKDGELYLQTEEELKNRKQTHRKMSKLVRTINRCPLNQKKQK